MKILNIIILCLVFFTTSMNIGKRKEIYTKTTFYRIGHNNKLSGFLNQNPYALYKVLISHNYSCLAPLVSDATCYTYMVVIFFALFTIK